MGKIIPGFIPPKSRGMFLPGTYIRGKV